MLLRMWRNQNPQTLLLRIWTGSAFWKIICQLLKQLNQTTQDFSQVYTQKNKNLCLSKTLYTNVYESIIYNIQKIETKQMFINRQMDK